MELMEKARHGSDKWLFERWRRPDGRAAFGFSDASALMGVSPYKTRADLFLEKREGPVRVQESWAMRKGNLMEPLLVAEGGRRLGVELVTPEVVYTEGRWVGSLDAVPAASVEAPEFIAEVKVTGRYVVNDADDLPAEWLAQGHAQHAIVGCPVMFFVFDRHQNFNIVEMPVNDAYSDAILSEAERVGSLVDAEAPLPDEFLQDMDADSIANAFQPERPTTDLSDDAENWVKALEAAREAKAAAEAMEKDAKDQLARLLLDAEVGLVRGVPVVSWKQTAGRESFDVKAFTAAHPELAAQFVRQGKPFRTMRLLGRKGD